MSEWTNECVHCVFLSQMHVYNSSTTIYITRLSLSYPIAIHCIASHCTETWNLWNVYGAFDSHFINALIYNVYAMVRLHLLWMDYKRKKEWKKINAYIYIFNWNSANIINAISVHHPNNILCYYVHAITVNELKCFVSTFIFCQYFFLFKLLILIKSM